MKLSEAPIGLRVAMVESMADARSNEIRHTFYERREGEAKFTTNPDKPTAFVTAYHLRTVQGEAGEHPRFDTGEIHVACEVDGRIEVVDAAMLMVGASKRRVAAMEVPSVSQQADLVYLAAALRSDHPEVVQAVNAAIMIAKVAGVEVPHTIGIGTRFMNGDQEWQCTDVGCRTITAMRIDEHPEDSSYYNGPPYGVAEYVFDEYDLPLVMENLKDC